ncbi:ABC transporter permease [Bacteroidia bacterium]|nr:ABC transporter permease [Bacteroidia bacterium]
MIKNFLFVLNRFKTSSILNILGLSVAFAVFIVIMMQVHYDYTFDKFHPDNNRIFRVDFILGDGSKQAVIPRPLAEAWFQSSPHIVAGTITNFNVSGKDLISIEKNGSKFSSVENTLKVSPDYTKVFPFDMTEGTITGLDNPDEILIPQSLAKKLFGEESAIGKPLSINERQFTVKGVYKDFPANSLLKNCVYIPMDKDENMNYFGNWSYYVYVRLDSPEATAGLIENMSQIARDLIEKAWGNTLEGEVIQFTNLPDLHFTTDVKFDATPKSSRQTVFVLISIAIAIVLIAGINFTNFSMALAPRRIRSINTQKILGASVARLRTVLAAEAVLISLTAYFISLFLVYAVSKTPVAGLLDCSIQLSAHPGLSGITAFLAIVTGIVSGLYPAFYITSFQPALALKGSFGLSLQGRKMRNVLMGIQFTASMILIISAIFMYLQNDFMKNMSLGFDRERIVTVTNLSATVKNNQKVFENELKSFAGIVDVTYGEFLLASSDQYMHWGRLYQDKEIQFYCMPVDPSFLKVMGIPVTEGRDFREDDGQHEKYIFNEKARKEYDMQLNTYMDEGEIIGFIPDIQFTTFRTTPSPMAFYVASWTNTRMNIAYIKVSAGSGMREAIQHIQNTLSKLDPDWAFNVGTFDDAILKGVHQKEQRLTFLITLFSAIAILISIIGVFGLIVFETAYRRKEISIRKVHGSSVKEILSLFNRIYLILLGICFLIACPVTYLVIGKWFENFAYKTSMYWWVFLLGGIIVLVITLITVSTQSYKAARRNPIKALNSE